MMHTLKPSKSFYQKDISSYIVGFGQPTEENYWLGLKSLYDVTKGNDHITLRIEALSWGYLKMIGDYEGFKVIRTGNRNKGYAITYKTYTTNCKSYHICFIT